MGTLYKRGSVWWMQYYRHGKAYRESAGTTKESEAKRLLKVREGEISKGGLPGLFFDRVRFEDLAEDFLLDYRVSGKKTLDRAERVVRLYLGPFFSGMRVPDITTLVIQKYISARMNAGASNATINRELAALKRMMNLGARRTPPKVDRVPYIPTLREDNARKGFFEHGDFISLRDALPDHLKGFVTFGYRTGWRLGEIAGLQWNQVDRERGMVRLNPGETKNDQGRIIYLDPELREVLKGLWERRIETGSALPYVFLNAEGTDRVKRFYKAWKAACQKAGIGVRLFHDFRRTAVRNMIRAGVPERVCMMISGHKTRSVFDRYNVTSDADLQLAAEHQAAYLEAQAGKKNRHKIDTIGKTLVRKSLRPRSSGG